MYHAWNRRLYLCVELMPFYNAKNCVFRSAADVDGILSSYNPVQKDPMCP